MCPGVSKLSAKIAALQGSLVSAILTAANAMQLSMMHSIHLALNIVTTDHVDVNTHEASNLLSDSLVATDAVH